MTSYWFEDYSIAQINTVKRISIFSWLMSFLCAVVVSTCLLVLF